MPKVMRTMSTMDMVTSTTSVARLLAEPHHTKRNIRMSSMSTRQRLRK